MAENLAGRRKDLAHVNLLRRVVAPYLADLVGRRSTVVRAEVEQTRSVHIIQAADIQLALAAAGALAPDPSHALPSVPPLDGFDQKLPSGRRSRG